MDERVQGGCGRHGLEPPKSAYETPNEAHSRNIEPPQLGSGQGPDIHSRVTVEGVRGGHYSDVGESDMVARPGGHAMWVDRSGKTRRPESEGVASSQWASSLLDRITGSNEALLWAKRTREKYGRIVGRFVSWWIGEKGNDERLENKANKRDVYVELAAHILEFLRSIAVDVSGEQINTIGRILLRLFQPYMNEAQYNDSMGKLKVLRRDTNLINPPQKQAADAVSLQDLQTLWRRAREVKLTPIEKLAIEILTVAFATVSRVAEIAGLRVRDVAEEGTLISIRAKTSAKSCDRHLKRVRNGCEIQPVHILKRRRELAILLGNDFLFLTCANAPPLTSSEVTNTLKRLTGKLNMNCRITAHSGRKGAAVAALMAGVPIPIIQSLGLWQCQDSLQAYLGKAIRDQFCALDFLSSKQRN